MTPLNLWFGLLGVFPLKLSNPNGMGLQETGSVSVAAH